MFEGVSTRGPPLAAPGQREFRFKNRLVSLDSMVIDRCARLFS